MSLTYHIEPGGVLKGRIRVPGDKSISHRSIMLASIAEGVTRVGGFLEGEDAIATMNAFRALGVRIEGPQRGNVTVHGVGLHGLRRPGAALDCGNAGTAMRLLAGLLAGQDFDCELTGDDSLRQRPMKRIAEPLNRMGAYIETAEGGRPPLRVHGGRKLNGMDYTMPMASAQVKSALLLAGLYADGRTCVTEPAPTRDHTERMLEAFGCRVQRNGATVCVHGGAKLRATAIEVPADISSAAFFLVGAAMTPGSDLTLERVGINPTRTGIIEILRRMGANLELVNEHTAGAEPIADIRVQGARLRGIEVPRELVPLAIDEFPAVFVAAANAEGTTVVTGAQELRVKESDRIQTMADGLQALGVQAEPTPDGMRVTGGPYRGGRVASHGDHRVAMAFAVAGLRAATAITIADCANVATSFPGFVELASKAGLKVTAN